MTRYGFTGTASLDKIVTAEDAFRRHQARSLVWNRAGGTEYTTGAQVGFDALACREAMAAFPDALHRVIVPRAPHDEQLVADAYALGAVIVTAPAGRITKSDPTGHRSAYRNRNELVLEHSDVLVACARLPEARLPYSGTWATVRLGRKAGKPIIVQILEGDRAAAAPAPLGAATDRPHEAVDAPGKERS